MDPSSLAWHFPSFGLNWQRMRYEHQAVRPPAGRGFIVVSRDKRGDGARQLMGERDTIRRRAEADFRVDGECREILVGLPCPAPEVPDFTHDACAECDQIARGQPVG